MAAGKQFLKGLMDNPNFQKWFGESVVRDAEGLPLEVYKAMPGVDYVTGSPITKVMRGTEFPAFNNGEPGINISGFFAGDPEVANKFTHMTKPAAPVYPGYVSLNRPYIVDAAGGKSGDIQFGESGKPFRDAIRSGKFDGAIIKNTGDEGDVYVTLDPTQFKSRFNAGTFDPSDPNFLKSAGLMTVGAGAAAYGMSPDDAEAARIPKFLDFGDVKLPIDAKGMATLYHATSPEAADNIVSSKMLKSAGEPSVYFSTSKEGTGYGPAVVEAKVPGSMLQMDDVFPDGRADFRVDKSTLPLAYVKRIAGLGLTGAGAYGLMGGDSDAEAAYIGPKGLANLLGTDAAKSLLTEAEQMAAKGLDNEAVRQATGLFQGMDGKWRFEVDDSRFKVNDVLSNLKTGGYGPKDISKVDYAVRPDGKYDATLIPYNPQRVSDLVSLTGVDDGILRSVFPDEVLGKIKSGAGEETYVGKDFLEGKSLQSPFKFEGFNALPSDVAVSHDALFKAYPDLGDVMVSVDPKTGIGGSYSLMDTGDSVIKVGTGQQPGTLLHELQHAIQQREGFARGGSPSEFDMSVSQPGIDRAYKELGTKIGERYSELGKAGTTDFMSDPVLRELMAEKQSYEKSFPHLMEKPFVSYQNLAGEIEARDVASRMNLTPEQRRATPPDLRDNAIVRFDGGQAASVPQRREWAKDAISTLPNVAQSMPLNQQDVSDNNFWETALGGARAIGKEIDSASKYLGPLVMNAPSRFISATAKDPVGMASNIADFIVPFKSSARDYADAFYHNQDATWLDKINALAGIGLDAAFFGHGNQAKNIAMGLMR